jgi:hypothetical protein
MGLFRFTSGVLFTVFFSNPLSLRWIWGYLLGEHEEWFVENPTFLRNLAPPLSGINRVRNQQAVYLIIISCLAYSSKTRMRAICSLKYGASSELQGVITQKNAACTPCISLHVSVNTLTYIDSKAKRESNRSWGSVTVWHRGWQCGVFIASSISFILQLYNLFLFLWRYCPNLGLGLPPWKSPFHFRFLDLSR